jgi:uncharacterized phage protein (TIGR01671 family)
MREIKFRGNRIDNNEMVKGSLLIEKIEKPTLKIDPIGEYKELEEITSYSICVDGGTKDGKVWCEVDPATVGQYTGLIDEKGAQVFEGDIVECYGEDSEVILVAEVQFQEGGFCVQIDYDLQLIPLDAFGSAYKVIGNIHEHPNLLTNE